MFAVRDIVTTDVAASGSLIEFCRGTLTTSLLGAALSTLLSSSDALEIGSSKMGVVWHTFFAGALPMGAAVLSEGTTLVIPTVPPQLLHSWDLLEYIPPPPRTIWISRSVYENIHLTGWA